jgi:membrane protein
VGTYLYSDRAVLTHVRQYLENVAPSLDPRIMSNILKIMRDRKIVGILGMAGLIWSSTWLFSSLRITLNTVFQVEKSRGLIRGKGIDLLMIFLAGIFLVMSMSVSSAVTYIQGFHFKFLLNLGPPLRFLLKYVIPFFFSFSMFFLFYKIVPNKKISLGSALQATGYATMLWEAARQSFGWYVLHLARFSMLYGSLSTLAIFFLWFYYSSAILILGSEVAFLLEKKKE